MAYNGASEALPSSQWLEVEYVAVLGRVPWPLLCASTTLILPALDFIA